MIDYSKRNMVYTLLFVEITVCLKGKVSRVTRRTSALCCTFSRVFKFHCSFQCSFSVL